MIAETGHLALILALLVALVQATLPLAGAARNHAPWLAVARPAALAQFAFVAIAFGCLMHAYVTSDFSVRNVFENSHSAKPLLYKFTGVWGNHEGSMVLWVLILTTFGAAVAAFGTNLPPTLRARVLAVQAMIGVGFLTFTLFTSNPFERLFPVPADGRDLNPLLQDPALSFHPPFLYLGYVGLSTTFSFAVAALIEGRVDAAWGRWVRPWTLAAWCFLGTGIAMGSWWAYYELGWGGWWFWDPVENASFMPWLVATALLHSAIVVEKRDALKSWTILLAIVAFSLSLIGTFLVRSGVLTSVHSFANDPGRGLFILLLLVVAIGGSLTLYAIRAPALKGGGLFAPISREGGLVLNNLLLATAAGTVFLGTLYPLFVDALKLGKVSVGKPYFDATFVPLMVPVLVVMTAGPMLAWKRADLRAVVQRLGFAFAAALIAAAVTWYLAFGGPLLALLGIGLTAWIIGGVLTDLAERVRLFRLPLGASLRRARGLPRSAWGTALAHAGVGVIVAGITGSSAWQTEKVLTMRIGDSTEVAGYSFTLDSVAPGQGPNYALERGSFDVTRDGARVVRLTPERRFYPVQQRQTTEAAIHSNGRADLYAVLGDGNAENGWTVRLYHNPLIPWLWAGVVITVLGGVLSLSDRRFRIGAPTRARRSLGAAPQAAAGD